MDDDEKYLELLAAVAAMEDSPEKTIWERQLAALQDMPPEQRAAAIQNFSRDYEGRRSALMGDLTSARTDMADALAMPQSRVAGPSSNPFAITVAPNVTEYMAQGLRAYDASQRGKEARQGLEALSEQQEAGIGSMMAAGMTPQEAQAEMLRRREEERLRRFRT